MSLSFEFTVDEIRFNQQYRNKLRSIEQTLLCIEQDFLLIPNPDLNDHRIVINEKFEEIFRLLHQWQNRVNVQVTQMVTGRARE